MAIAVCMPSASKSCGRFFGRLKTESFYSRNWFATTVEEFDAALDRYVRYYSEERIKILLGPRSPIEHLRHLGVLLNPSKIPAASPVAQNSVGASPFMLWRRNPFELRLQFKNIIVCLSFMARPHT